MGPDEVHSHHRIHAEQTNRAHEQHATSAVQGCGAARAGRPSVSSIAMGVLATALTTARTLPRAVIPVLLCTFLNSFRSFGFRFIQYSYITNEFGLSDVEAGYYLGIEAWLKTIFGLLGAVAVDLVGVRRLALFALTIAAGGRALLTFGTSRSALLASIIGFTPAGEALLSTGLYRVALKKLTTKRNRALAFSLECKSRRRICTSQPASHPPSANARVGATFADSSCVLNCFAHRRCHLQLERSTGGWPRGRLACTRRRSRLWPLLVATAPDDSGDVGGGLACMDHCCMLPL